TILLALLSEKRRVVVNDDGLAGLQQRGIRKFPILQKVRLLRLHELQRLGVFAAPQRHGARFVLDGSDDALTFARTRRTGPAFYRREPETQAERDHREATSSRDKSSVRVYGCSFHFGFSGMTPFSDSPGANGQQRFEFRLGDIQ